MLANKFIDSDNNTIFEQTAASVTAGSTLGNTYDTPAPTAPMNNDIGNQFSGGKPAGVVSTHRPPFSTDG